MSRLGEALTGRTTRRSRRSSSSTRTRPRATRTRPASARGLAREDLFTVVLEQRLTDTATSPTSSCRRRCSPSTSTCTSSYGHHYLALERAGGRPARRGLPNTEIFRRDRGVNGPRPPAAARLRRGARARSCSTTTLRGLEASRSSAARAGLDARRRLRARDGAVRRRRLPDAVGEGRARRRRRSRAGPRPARRLHAAARGRSTRSSPSGTRSCSSRRRPLLHELDVRLAPLAPRQAGPAAVHLHPDDAEARGLADGDAVRVHNDRGSFLGRRASTTRPGRASRSRYKAYWPKLVARRRERQRDDARARHGPRRRPDLPRHPRRGRAALRGSAQGRGHLGHGLAGRMRSGPYRL